MAIYNRFFSLNATDPLGVDEATRVNIESNICAEGGIKVDCFDRAIHLVFTALDQYYFPEFCQSDFYYKYLDGKPPTHTHTPVPLSTHRSG
jgi:A-kinase anchor protein 10